MTKRARPSSSKHRTALRTCRFAFPWRRCATFFIVRRICKPLRTGAFRLREHLICLIGFCRKTSRSSQKRQRPIVSGACLRPRYASRARVVRAAGSPDCAGPEEAGPIHSRSHGRATNVRRPANGRDVPRFWYMLPAFTARHLPAIFTPRINHGTPAVALNTQPPVLIGCQLLNAVGGARWTAYALYALFHSSWCRAAMEPPAPRLAAARSNSKRRTYVRYRFPFCRTATARACRARTAAGCGRAVSPAPDRHVHPGRFVARYERKRPQRRSAPYRLSP